MIFRSLSNMYHIACDFIYSHIQIYKKIRIVNKFIFVVKYLVIMWIDSQLEWNKSGKLLTE